MIKGIYFDDVHSYHDLNLVLNAGGVDIPPAEPKTNYIDIPGGDGSLDFTEGLGRVTYKDRNCTFKFTLNPNGDLSQEAFEEKKTEISNLLNGKACRITLDKDPDYYYQGRCKVDEHAQDRQILQFTVSAVVRPYKLKQTKTVVTVDLSSTEKEVILMNSKKTVVPLITCTNDNTFVSFGDSQTTLSEGTHKVLDFCLSEGENIFKVSGSGMITFTYQEGEL